MSIGIKTKPSWLGAVENTTNVVKSTMHLDFNAQATMQAGDRVRAVKSIHVGETFIPIGATGTIAATDSVIHSIAFDTTNGVLDILPEEVVMLNHSAHDPKFFHTPDKKRVAAPSSWGNRLALIHMADSLEKLANAVGFYDAKTKVLHTELDPHDQYVRTAEFEIAFRTDDNIRQTVRASVGMDAANKRVIMPTTFAYLGQDIPFEKKAVEDLHNTRKIEFNENISPAGEQSYVKRDPARYHVTANVNNRSHTQVIEEQSKSPYRKVLADLVAQSGEEYEFDKKNYRDPDTGIPNTVDKNAEDFELWLDPEETTREYSTQDGQDAKLDKEERIENSTFSDTTSTRINPFEKIS